MKLKFILVVIIVFLCLAIALPASAKNNSRINKSKKIKCLVVKNGPIGDLNRSLNRKKKGNRIEKIYAVNVPKKMRKGDYPKYLIAISVAGQGMKTKDDIATFAVKSFKESDGKEYESPIIAISEKAKKIAPNYERKVFKQRKYKKTINALSGSRYEKRAIECVKSSYKKPLPKYEIKYNVINRHDGGSTYYVLINEVNLSHSNFKSDVKKVVSDVIKKKGKKNSVEIHEDMRSLEISYKQYGAMTLGRARTEVENQILERHMIALYSGELDTVGYNSLDFFPSAFSTSEDVGKYVDSEEYQP